MSEDVPNRRKIIVPSAPKSAHAVSIIEPGIDQLLDDALSIVQAEIIAYKAKTNKGQRLDLQESRVVQGYIKSLCEIKKEQARAADERDLANLTDEELLQLVQKLTDKAKELPSGSNNKAD